jgi:Carboxypeptidase regulatory-like domain
MNSAHKGTTMKCGNCASILLFSLLGIGVVQAQSGREPGSQVELDLSGSGSQTYTFTYGGNASRVDTVSVQISVNLQVHPYSPKANDLLFSSSVADFSGTLAINVTATETEPGSSNTKNLQNEIHFNSTAFPVDTEFFGPGFVGVNGNVARLMLSLVDPNTIASQDPVPYRLLYDGTNEELTVWIRLPSPFIYPAYPSDDEAWQIPCTATVTGNGSSLDGLVEDAATGKPLPGATVVVGGRTFTTDANGSFLTPLLPPGWLDVKITDPGYGPYEHGAVLPPFEAVHETFHLTNAPLPVILVHGYRPHRATDEPGKPVDIWWNLEHLLDSKGYLDLSNSNSWPSAVGQLPAKFYIEFTYADMLRSFPNASGDPRQYAAALGDMIASFRRHTGYEGKFDLVCHSMGALVSRWYMDRGGGASSIRQWIGIAPVNRGAALANKRELLWPLLPFFGLPPINWLDFWRLPDLRADGAVTQMETILSDNTVAELNSAGGLPQIQPGVIYRVLAGWNQTGLQNELKGVPWSRTQYPEGSFFRENIGKTYVSIVDANRHLHSHATTYYGDGVVALEQSRLSASQDVDLFPDQDHSSLLADGDVLNRVVLYLLNPSAPALNNGPSEAALQADADVPNGVVFQQGTQGNGFQGHEAVQSFLVDSSVDEMDVSLLYPGSRMLLSLVSPSGQTFSSASTNTAGAYVADGVAAFSLATPETGVWQAIIDPVEVSTNGEPYLFGVIFDSDIDLDVAVKGNQTEVPLGDTCALTAVLQQDSMSVTGAVVTAQMTGPDGASKPLTFYDDGTRGDTNAGDGVFSATATLDLAGPYVIRVQADARLAGGPVRRSASISLLSEVEGQLPTLTISAAEGFVDLAWADRTSAFQLESCTALSQGTVWTPVTNAPTSTMNQYGLILPVGGQGTLYRLYEPR